MEPGGGNQAGCCDDPLPVSQHELFCCATTIPQPALIPACLPGEFHAPWIKALDDGRRPDIGFNRGGFYVRAWTIRGTNPDPEADADTQTTNDRPGGSDGATRSKARRKAGPFLIRPFVPRDPLTLPPRSWLYSRHYMRRSVSATIAPGGTGKSSLDLTEAIAMATCRNLLGEQPEARLRVWYHNGEDDRDEIDRRILAICQHYNIPQEELRDWLFVTSGAEFPLRVAQGYSNLEINELLIKQIREGVGDLKLDVCSLDPLITLHGVPEGDNGKMYRVVRVFADIGDELDCAFELAHHTRKGPPGGNPYEYTADDMRGASAVRDAVRAARILNHMSAAEAEEVSIPEYDRGTYFRVDRAKGNYSRPAKAAVWRQFVSVELPNEDDVGVIVHVGFSRDRATNAGAGRRRPESGNSVPAAARQVHRPRHQRQRQRRPQLRPGQVRGRTRGEGRERLQGGAQDRHDPPARQRPGPVRVGPAQARSAPARIHTRERHNEVCRILVVHWSNTGPTYSPYPYSICDRHIPIVVGSQGRLRRALRRSPCGPP